MRSAWIKWARGVEHQQVLARAVREFDFSKAYAYERTDNVGDVADPVVRVQWRLKVLEPFPERWGAVVGDVLTNLRAALDHTFWAAVMAHTGMPPKPQLVTFPLSVAHDKIFKDKVKNLRPLVAPEFWELVEAVQPFRSERPMDEPLEWLRWVSNADKHRAVRVIGQMAFDMGPVIFDGERYEMVEEARFTGPVEDDAVVARLTFKRPVGGRSVNLVPTFAYSPVVQVGEEVDRVEPLHVVMEAMRRHVVDVVDKATAILGARRPSLDELELGMEHVAVAAENAGVIATFRDQRGTVHRLDVPAGDEVRAAARKWAGLPG
ncbi:hypothetical protein AB0I60_01370 [Actinosynnema sp. NPDC050436]|uniref:hypothetical protein n=1 Tax=Actinosynnema sp. NPDC050436 TaxID=3155659 RepID=UPI0033FA439D